MQGIAWGRSEASRYVEIKKEELENYEQGFAEIKRKIALAQALKCSDAEGLADSQSGQLLRAFLCLVNGMQNTPSPSQGEEKIVVAAHVAASGEWWCVSCRQTPGHRVRRRKERSELPEALKLHPEDVQVGDFFTECADQLLDAVEGLPSAETADTDEWEWD